MFNDADGGKLIKSTILTLLAKFQITLSIYHKSLVYIEGGLGSQILGVISFWERQAKYGFLKTKCDLSYFRSVERKKLWNWELNHYGIDLNDFKKFESTSRWNFLKLKADFLSEAEMDAGYWTQARSKYLNRFEINHKVLENLKSTIEPLQKLSSYGAVHIRRGDYLQVASKVISFKEYVEILTSLKNLIPKNLLIVSDTHLQEQEKTLLIDLFRGSHNLVFLDDPQLNLYLIHCILREADVLVTSNSTFSFSAALLGKSGQLAFSPVTFHSGPNAEKYNRSFRAAGLFMSLKVEE